MVRKRLSSALNVGEKILKTDVRYVARGGFWLSSAHLLTGFFSFLTSIAFANLIDQETYGIYKYIITLGGIAAVFSLSGIGTALSRAIARGFEGSFVDLLKKNILWGLFTTIAALAGAGYYFLNDNTTLAWGLVVVAILSPILDSLELHNSYLNGKKAFATNAFLRIGRGVFVFLGLSSVLFFEKNPVIIVCFYFIFHTIAAGIGHLITVKLFKPQGTIDPEAFGLSKHLSAMSVLSNIADRIDNILVFHYLGAAQLALYNFALIIPTHISSFVKQVGTLAMPRFATQEKKIIQQSLFRKTLLLFLVSIPIFIVYVLTAPWIFKIFFPLYIESITYTQVYGTIILISGVLPIAFLDSQLAIKEKYFLTAVNNITKIILLFVGVLSYGIWGLIIARIISKAVGSSLAYAIARKL